MAAKCSVGGAFSGEIEEPALDALEAVLQTEVEDLARVRGKVPERLAPRYPETQPQRQDFPIFGAPASRYSPWGRRSSTRKEIGS